jgi:hypothetical protein
MNRRCTIGHFFFAGVEICCDTFVTNSLPPADGIDALGFLVQDALSIVDIVWIILAKEHETRVVMNPARNDIHNFVAFFVQKLGIPDPQQRSRD